MTEQEREFCKHYLSNGGNATEAARAAGYAPKSAKSRGSMLLGRSEVGEHIALVQAELAAKNHGQALHHIDGVRQWWIDVMTGAKLEHALPADRIRCSGMLAKSLGAFVDKIDANLTVQVVYSDEGEAF